MASTVVGVKVSAPVFSSLLYEHASSRGDQEGFLLGEVKTRVVGVISDTQINSEKEEIAIDVHTILPCANNHQFYNNFGEITENILQNILKNDYKNVIGWYRFRRNTHLEPMTVESALHQKLASLMPMPPHLFVFAIFTACASNNTATHSFDHVFLRHINKQFETISVSVINLGNTSQMEYKTHSHSIVNAYLNRFGVPQNSLVANESLASIGTIQEIQRMLNGNLQGLHRQVQDSEHLVQQSVQEICFLRKMLKEKQNTYRELSQETLPAMGPTAKLIKSDLSVFLPPAVLASPSQECAVDTAIAASLWINADSGVNVKQEQKKSSDVQ